MPYLYQNLYHYLYLKHCNQSTINIYGCLKNIEILMGFSKPLKFLMVVTIANLNLRNAFNKQLSL